MKKDIFENRFKRGNVFKIFFANIVCFLLVAVVSVAFCYSYFSDKVDVSGDTSTALLSIDYQDNSNVSISNIYAKLNGDTATTLTGISICPGDEITISGSAVNTSDVAIYVLGKMEVTNKDTSGNIIDKEIVWYNIADNAPLYIQQGLFQIGASSLEVGASQALSVPYTFEGDRYDNNYATIELNFTLYAHQKDYLELADDYGKYTEAIGYTQSSIYATHYMTGRLRDVWYSSDAEVEGLTLSDLETDNSGAYLINSCKDWMIVKANSTASNNYCEGLTFKLNAYLDFDYDKSMAFDKTIDTFKGDFDGQGYTISKWIGDQGLFYNAWGKISNLGVEGLVIANSIEKYVGGITAILNDNIIENCFVAGASGYNDFANVDIASDYDSEDIVIGGIVGCFNGTSIMRDCWAMITMNYVGNSTGVNMGGLVGKCVATSAQVNNCYFIGGMMSNVLTNAQCALIANISGNASINNCFAFDILGSTLTHESKVAGQDGIVNNCMYFEAVDEDINGVKVGENQTDKTLSVDKLTSVGKLRDAFGWDTSIWVSEVQVYNSRLICGQRVFYNF